MESFNLKIFLRNTIIAGFLTTILGLISQYIIQKNTRFEQKKINERAAFDKTTELFYQRRYLMWQKLNCISDSTTSQEIKEYYNNKYLECLLDYNSQITEAVASPIFRDFIGANHIKYLEKNAWETLNSYNKLREYIRAFHKCLNLINKNKVDEIDSILRVTNISKKIDGYSMLNKKECLETLNNGLKIINDELFIFIDLWNKEIYLEVKESAKPSKQ